MCFEGFKIIIIVGEASIQFKAQKKIHRWSLFKFSKSARGSWFSSVQEHIFARVVYMDVYISSMIYITWFLFELISPLTEHSALDCWKRPLGAQGSLKIIKWEHSSLWLSKKATRGSRLGWMPRWTALIPHTAQATYHQLLLRPQLWPTPELPFLVGQWQWPWRDIWAFIMSQALF